MPRSPRPARRSLTPHVTPLVAALVAALCSALLLTLAPATAPAASATASAAAQVVHGAQVAPHLPRPTPVTGLVADLADLVGPPASGPVAKLKPRRLLRTMLRLVNVVRSVPQLCGTELLPAAGPLKRNKRLTRAARGYARKMARKDWFEHDSPNGDDPGDRISDAGYRWSRWGENIGAGYDDVASVVAAWMASPGHCTVLMGSFRHVGFGYAYHRKSTFGHYWVQDFARPRRG